MEGEGGRPKVAMQIAARGVLHPGSAASSADNPIMSAETNHNAIGTQAMARDLSGLVALVTGANSGLGK
jgi:hypothetical protein